MGPFDPTLMPFFFPDEKSIFGGTTHHIFSVTSNLHGGDFGLRYLGAGFCRDEMMEGRCADSQLLI